MRGFSFVRSGQCRLLFRPGCHFDRREKSFLMWSAAPTSPKSYYALPAQGSISFARPKEMDERKRRPAVLNRLGLVARLHDKSAQNSPARLRRSRAQTCRADFVPARATAKTRTDGRKPSSPGLERV